MKKNILITWTSKWIWKNLVSELKNENQIFWISRTKTQQKWFIEINFDLTNFLDFYKINKILEQQKIKLDCIILNAWVGYFWKYEEWKNEKYQEIINLNLLSPILFIKNIEKYLDKNAKIIFIWSIVSKKFLKYWAVYQASKFWLRWFAWALKNEMKNKKIFFINPKIVKTSFHKNSKINLEIWENKITSLKDITDCVKNILKWKEKRFEIDF